MAKDRKIQFIRKFYNRTDYTTFIDNSFKELNLPHPSNPIGEELFTDPKGQVTQFFNFYDKVFYLIPELGENNSHEYLAKTSGELVDFNEINSGIGLLQDEIAALREDLLESQKLILELQNENDELKSTLNITTATTTTT